MGCEKGKGKKYGPRQRRGIAFFFFFFFFLALALYFYNNFDLCLSAYFCLRYKVQYLFISSTHVLV